MTRINISKVKAGDKVYFHNRVLPKEVIAKEESSIKIKNRDLALYTLILKERGYPSVYTCTRDGKDFFGDKNLGDIVKCN